MGTILFPGGPLDLVGHAATLKEVSLERGRALFSVGKSSRMASVPLRDVLEVWESSKGVWRVRVRGRLMLEDSDHALDAYQPVVD